MAHRCIRRSLFASACLAVAVAAAGCGVPKSQYDAAVDDAKKAHAELAEQVASLHKENDELAAKLAAAEGKMAASDEATRAELDELRKQKAAADARLKLLEEFLAKFK